MEIKRRYVVDARVRAFRASSIPSGRVASGNSKKILSEGPQSRAIARLQRFPFFSLSLSVSLCLTREARALLLSIPRKRVASGDRRVNLALSA